MPTHNEVLVLLAIRRRIRDAYGVVIRNEIEEQTGTKLSFGGLYTILSRLEQDGLVTSREGEATPERGGKAKRYFSITGKGQRILAQTFESFDRMRDSAVALQGGVA
ncbi:MAG: PadR family transcriptional regulator [Reyranella sp.]|uniref:PadR family transcriptional regulator n=1 Tax=Reyranella sp. TaxID=1929291 RepID=UPI001200F782|nr:PadR family transcriptional regulator [Reyranella sp.]TAJ86484.1 MAG: PadR family transcriptional regulator [Reyranella sp.]TBR24086.1 MAG: PadR family transcriptional regulator [Reyranella sp.]